MLKVKKQVIRGILIGTMLILLVAVSVPASAVNSSTAVGGGQAQDSGAEPEIKLETPSAADPQTHGRADIEKVFPTIDDSVAANGENSSDPRATESPSQSSQELQIIYEQQQDNETTESDTSTDTKAIENPRNKLLLLAIPLIIVLLVFAAFQIKRIRKKEEVKQ